MAKRILRWLREFMADMTSAAPRWRVYPESMDLIPRTVVSADLASPYFLAMLDRDASWYQDRVRHSERAGQQ